MEEVKQQQDSMIMKLDAVGDDVKLCGRRLELIENNETEAETHLKEVFDNVKKNQECISIVITCQQETSTQIMDDISKMRDKLVMECRMVKETVEEMSMKMKDQVEILKHGAMEVLNRESVMDEHLKKIFDNTVCGQLGMKDIARLENDNLKTVLENFWTVKEVVVQCGDNMLNMIGTVLSEASNKISIYRRD
jgi:hypothetical protein